MIQGRPRKTDSGILNQRQLISLQNRVRYEQIRSAIQRGLLYGETDPGNRTAVLSTARSDLEKLIPLIEKVDPAWWESRLDLLRCLRLIGEYPTADRLLETYPVEEAMPRVQLGFKAERIRLALVRGDLKLAESLIASGRQIGSVVSGDFDFAILEFLLARHRVALVQGASEKQMLIAQQNVLKAVKSIENLHGTYWGRRANLALIASTESSGAGGSETLIRVARESYRKKKYLQSIEEFEKAASAARKELNRKLELELKFQAVSIHRSLSQHHEVLTKAKKISSEFRDTRRAAVVHLVGILSAAQLVREGDLEIAEYVQLLDEHLRLWPQEATSAEVALFRGEYDFAQRKFVPSALSCMRALSLLEGRPREVDRYLAGCLKFQECLVAISGNPQAKQELVQSLDTSRFFRPLPSTDGRREVQLECWATYVLEIDPANAGPVLRAIRQHQAPGTRLKLSWLRLVCLQGDEELSRKLVMALKEELGEADRNALIEGLERDDRRASPVARKCIARVLLQLPVSQSVKDAKVEFFAEANLQLGRKQEARLALARAARTNPRSARIQKALARVLAESSEKEDLETALGIWRKILAQSRSGSEPWLEAKYQIPRCYLALGDRERARTLLELMQAVPPGWQESTWKTRFDALWESVSR